MDMLRHHAEARRLLAALLCEPDTALYRDEDVVTRLKDALGAIAPNFPLPDLDPGEGDELLVAYTKLFLGPGHVPAPPYGSVYLDKDGLVAGPSTQAVKAFYAEEGLGVERTAAELPDHVAIELEFSAHLLDSARNCGDEGTRTALLRRHEEFDARFLRSWLPSLGRNIQVSAVHPFYDAVGSILCALPPVPLAELEASH